MCASQHMWAVRGQPTGTGSPLLPGSQGSNSRLLACLESIFIHWGILLALKRFFVGGVHACVRVCMLWCMYIGSPCLCLSILELQAYTAMPGFLHRYRGFELRSSYFYSECFHPLSHHPNTYINLTTDHYTGFRINVWHSVVCCSHFQAGMLQALCAMFFRYCRADFHNLVQQGH